MCLSVLLSLLINKVKRSLLSSSTSPKNSSLLTPSPSISITDPENSDVDSPSSRIVTSHGLAAGYISQVTMMNFMCHGHLTVDLGPGMNFIIGQNGSGKSTVLTAISTCLGGKASNTQRASSLKSFVKEGQSKAVVQVVFCNEGRGAYEFEKYGSSILIERSIIRDTGFSGYKIKDYKGKTISDKRKELDRILEAYRIQIDNPFAILTQDTARTFLTASSEKAKYDYFRRALLFDKIETYRDGTYDKLKLSEINLDHKQKELKEKAKEMEKWTHMYESMEMSSDAEKKINELSGLLYWNRVLELEKKISENELLINKTENEIQDIKKTHELLVERYAEADKALSEHEEKGAVLSSQYGDLNNKMQQAENEIDHIKNELKCHDEAKKNLLDNQKSIKDSIESIEDKIKSLRAKDDELYGNKREELENKKRELKDRIRKIGIEFNNLRSEEEQLMQKLSVFPSTLEPLHRRANEIDHLIKTETSTLRSLKNKQSDKLRAFGENFSSIMKDISASNKFSGHLPIGPIGSHITLKDPVWGSVLETILSRVLTGFIVENHDDRVILQNILDKYRARNPIFVRTLDRFDFKSSVPNKNHLTILDVLDIKDDNVKYLLIDFSIIERTILVKGRRKADDLMYNRPENVYRCLAIQPDNSTIAYSVGSRITGASKVEPITPWKDLPRMMTDTSFQIHTLNDSIEKNKSQKIEIEAEISSIRGKKSNIDQKIVEIKRTLSRLKAEQQSSEGQIDGIETELDVERDTTKLRELYATLDEQKEQLEQYEHQFVDLYDAKDEVQKRLQEAITRRQGIEKEKKVVRRSLQEHSVSCIFFLFFSFVNCD